MTELQKGESVTEPNTDCVEVVVTAEAADWLAQWTASTPTTCRA
jgi:hypothetical protein